MYLSKIVYITDLAKSGSGYMSLSLPLCEGLAKTHEVKVIGFGYEGEEHDFNFPIFQARNEKDIVKTVAGMWAIWNFDYLFVALDITLQERLLNQIGDRPFRWVGVFPVEADPLCFTWANVLMSMDKQFIISEFGTNEAKKKGIVTAEHIQIGIDTNSWRRPTEEERSKLRKAYNIPDDTKVVLTNADNQERKNLFACFEAFSRFAKEEPNSKYILITREHNFAGWKLKDLAIEYKIADKLMIVERGMPFAQLWSYYAMSDVLLSLSKAEGLNLTVLEAMATGLPVIATNCTALMELCADGRGILVPWNYRYIDPFGNSYRYLADFESAAYNLMDVLNDKLYPEMIEKAHKYAESRTWDIPVNQINEYIRKDQDEKEKQQPSD